jgi:hypothetical protein
MPLDSPLWDWQPEFRTALIATRHKRALQVLVQPQDVHSIGEHPGDQDVAEPPAIASDLSPTSAHTQPSLREAAYTSYVVTSHRGW